MDSYRPFGISRFVKCYEFKLELIVFALHTIFMIQSSLKITARLFAPALISGIILTIIAPYQTHTMNTAMRTLYWTGLVFAGGIGASLFDMVFRRTAPGKHQNLWLAAAAQSLGASLVVFICLIWLKLNQGSLAIDPFLLKLFFYIWVISIVICFVILLLQRRGAPAVLLDPAPNKPQLYQRLKPALRQAAIFALSAEDHYVRVFTDAGEDLILIRFGDAIKETHPLPGQQVHRSWWVAEAGVQNVTRQAGKMIIQLRSGQHVPVSKARAKILRQLNWV